MSETSEYEESIMRLSREIEEGKADNMVLKQQTTALRHEVGILRTTCDAHITVIGDKEDEIKALREERARVMDFINHVYGWLCRFPLGAAMDGDVVKVLHAEARALLADPEGQRSDEVDPLLLSQVRASAMQTTKGQRAGEEWRALHELEEFCRRVIPTTHLAEKLMQHLHAVERARQP